MIRLRRLLITAILTFALVSACRGNAPQQTGSQAVRVVDHALGKTKVPVNPQRVIALGGSLDTVLALGVQPVGSVEVDRQDYYLENQAKGIDSVGDSDNPNLEAIVALNPDLILGSKFDSPKTNKLLSQIAPTVIAEVDSSGEWKRMLSKYGEALGKTNQAKQVMSDYQARIDDFQAQLGDLLQQTEVSIVRIYQDRILIYLEDSFCGAIVADAGLPRPPAQASAETQFNMDISKEVLHKADGDVIFVWTYGSNEEIAKDDQTSLKQLKADPLWSKLDAVEQGKVYEVPGYWISAGPIAANLVLDDLFKYLVEK